MTLTDLEALLWLARFGSLQATARAVGVPRTTLRRRLDRLEAAIGVPLASIDSQSVTLTPAGELLVKRAPRLLSQREALREEARRVAPQPLESLRILTTTGFPPMFTAQVVSSVAAVAPQLHVELHHDPRPLDRLEEGFDVVVHWGEPPPPRDGYSRALLRQSRRLMATPAYLERQGTPRSVEALSEHTLLHLASEPRAWPLLEGGSAPIQPAHSVDDFYVLGCLAATGLGIALVPLGSTLLDAPLHALVPVLEDVVGEEVVVRVFLPTRTQTGGAPRMLLDMIQKLWGGADP